MRKLIPLLLLLVLVASCVQTTETASDSSKPVSKFKWYDSLVMDYMQYNQDTLLELANGMELEWKFDGMIETDSINFMAFRVGHTDEGRFITDDWVYIDSLKRQLYGYDTGTDSISLWQKK